MTFQAKPKQKNVYPKLLNEFEKRRTRDWLKAKLTRQQNLSVKAMDSRRMQMFSGKRGK